MPPRNKQKIPLNEFKSELNSIVGFSKLLLDGEAGKLSPEQKTQLQHIYKSGYKLMESIQERKSKIVVMWSLDGNILRDQSGALKLEIQQATGEDVYFLDSKSIDSHSVQLIKELNHIKESHAYTLIMATPESINNDRNLFEFADDVVIVSASSETENENQIAFLKAYSNFASKLSFIKLTDPLVTNRSRVIRKLCSRRVGLALSGGTAQGLAHIGVLKVLAKQKIPIDILAGTSGGALYGALFAAGLSPEQIVTHVKRVYRWNAIPNLDILIAKDGIFNSVTLVNKMLQKPFGKSGLNFSDLKMLFITVATDLLSGKERIIDKGSVIQAVRASIAIPIIFAPIKTRHNLFVDGIVTTPVPVLPLVERGADLVIAVHVSELSPYTKKRPNVLDIFMRARSITSEELSRHQLKDADIVIQPITKQFASFNYKKADEIIRAGEEAAWLAIPEIKQRLGMKY